MKTHNTELEGPWDQRHQNNARGKCTHIESGETTTWQEEDDITKAKTARHLSYCMQASWCRPSSKQNRISRDTITSQFLLWETLKTTLEYKKKNKQVDLKQTFSSLEKTKSNNKQTRRHTSVGWCRLKSAFEKQSLIFIKDFSSSCQRMRGIYMKFQTHNKTIWSYKNNKVAYESKMC